MPVRNFIPKTYHPISPRFRIPLKGATKDIEFEWDGAAMNSMGEIILIEDEGSTIVNIHIQGHVSRIALMVARGMRIKSLIWVVKKEEFARLWTLAEGWRKLLWIDMQTPTPAFEYRALDGELIAFSGEINGNNSQENN